MKTTGDAILFQLKSLGDAQAETLARRLRISVQAVRQRLERLLAEQLVEFADQPRGRGRPRRMWSLTAQAASLFPDTHAQLTVDLIGSIRAELGDTAFTRLLDRRAQEITATYRKKLEREPHVAGKLRALAEIRAAEGYMARLEEQPDGAYLLIEDHCPICAAATICQGFCGVELKVFRNLLGSDFQVDRQDHLLAGARRCTYQIARTSDSSARPT
jgi:predicted ArsR family transcriptional regulator